MEWTNLLLGITKAVESLFEKTQAGAFFVFEEHLKSLCRKHFCLKVLTAKMLPHASLVVVGEVLMLWLIELVKYEFLPCY